MKLALTLAALLTSLLGSPSHAQPSVVACDLIDQRVAASLLSEGIRQHSPNRQTQLIEGATFSTCVFFAERSSLVVKLLDYPSKTEAKRAFTASTATGGAASFSTEPRLGEAAAWWKMGTEGYGFVVQTGNRVLMIDTRWKDSNSGVGLKERLRPAVEAAVRRL
jgi:hypothetical protein